MKSVMVGWAGGLVFFLDDSGKPVSLDIYKPWHRETLGEYTPKLPPGWEGQLS